MDDFVDTVGIVNETEKEMSDRSQHMFGVAIAGRVRDEVTHTFYRKINALRERLIKNQERAKREIDMCRALFGTGRDPWRDMWEETEEERQRRYTQEHAYANAVRASEAIETQWGLISEAFGKDVIDAAWAWKEETNAK